MKHFLSMADVSREDINQLLNKADQLKYELKHGIKHHILEGKTLAMIFAKASTRTRVSFEVGMFQLGGSALFLSNADTQLGRGEPIEDTARVLSRYVDGIMIRTFAHSDVEALAKHGTVPVINALTDYTHPCQVLADLMTIREHKGRLEGLKLCYIGDGNNMANALIVGGLKAGMVVAAACPKGYEPDGRVLEYARGKAFELTEQPLWAAKDADVLVTDVWASMGQEGEAAVRRAAFEGLYQINGQVMEVAARDAMVLHCLPAHKGEEITGAVFEAHSGEIFDEAENRLHAQKAVLVTLMA